DRRRRRLAAGRPRAGGHRAAAAGLTRVAGTCRKSLKEIPAEVSDRGRGVRSRGERPPARGAPDHRRRSEMQYLVSVINDTAGLATPDEMAAIDAFNDDRLMAEGHWVFAGGLAAPSTAT